MLHMLQFFFNRKRQLCQLICGKQKCLPIVPVYISAMWSLLLTLCTLCYCKIPSQLWPNSLLNMFISTTLSAFDHATSSFHHTVGGQLCTITVQRPQSTRGCTQVPLFCCFLRTNYGISALNSLYN